MHQALSSNIAVLAQILAVGAVAFCILVGFRWILRKHEQKLFRDGCKHRWVDVRTYRRPVQRLFRKQVCNPCIKCGLLRPIEDVKGSEQI